jgi:dihydrodipicolinate synthase/N-acetylneuraminate lyase
MGCSKCRRLGSLWMIGQGLLIAFVPQLCVRMMQKMIGKNFENAEKLSAKPVLLRQLRACGIGMAAVGIAGFSMEWVASEPDRPSDPDESETTDAGCCCCD